jgi:hypothetical protein
MASSGKRKTTMAKLNRESKLRDKRALKAARKDARKRAAAAGPQEPVAEEFANENGDFMSENGDALNGDAPTDDELDTVAAPGQQV